MRYTRAPRRSAAPMAAVIAALAAIAALGIGMFLWEKYAGTKPAPDTSRGKTAEEMMGLTEGGEAPVFFDGKWYQKAKDVEAYLFMGVDRQGEADDVGMFRAGGQADVQLLMVIDNANERFRVFQLDRNTMVDMDILSLSYEKISTVSQQLALAYSYGDGVEKSCENNIKSVSNFLYGIPIDGYAALKMDSIEILNDMVGGVTVTIEDDLTPEDPTLIQGETIKLQGKQAFHFVHARMTVGDGKNTSRMRRHRAFLHGFEEQLRASMEADPEFVLKLYAALQDYLVTDMGSGVIAQIAQQCQNYENGGVLTVAGETVIGKNEWEEFYPDENDLRRIVLDLFYEEIPEQSAAASAAED